VDSADQAFPMLVATLLPAGIKGIVVGGLVAALMSSLASLFNSSATLFTVDFYKKFRPLSSERRLVFVGRVATAAVVLLGIVWIPVMKLVAGVLYEYLQQVQALIGPPIAAVFLLGVFSKRITGVAGFVGLVSGFALGMMRLALIIFQNRLEPGGFFHYIVSVNWLHYCIFLFFFTIVVMVVVSRYSTPKDPAEIQGLTYGSATPKQLAETRESWTRWDVIHTSVIVAVILGFYFRFF
jgi:solute:Na+ symporter, SSS family